MLDFLKDNWIVIVLSLFISILFSALIIGLSFGGEVTDRIAAWMSAIGTFGAVVVSLYLANKPATRPKISAKAELDYRKYIENTEFPDKITTEVNLEIYVENVGEQQLIIKNISWCYKNFVTPLKIKSWSIDGKSSEVKLITLFNSVTAAAIESYRADGKPIPFTYYIEPSNLFDPNILESESEFKKALQSGDYSIKIEQWNGHSYYIKHFED